MHGIVKTRRRFVSRLRSLKYKRGVTRTRRGARRYKRSFARAFRARRGRYFRRRGYGRFRYGKKTSGYSRRRRFIRRFRRTGRHGWRYWNAKKRSTLSKLTYHEPNICRTSFGLVAGGGTGGPVAAYVDGYGNQLCFSDAQLLAQQTNWANVAGRYPFHIQEDIIIDNQFFLSDVDTMTGYSHRPNMPERAIFRGNSFFLKSFWVKFLVSYGCPYDPESNPLPELCKCVEIFLLRNNTPAMQDFYQSTGVGVPAFMNVGPIGAQRPTQVDGWWDWDNLRVSKPMAFLKDRGAENWQRNPSSLRMWTIVKYKKFKMFKPKMHDYSTPSPAFADDYRGFDDKVGLRKCFFRMWGMRRIKLLIYHPNFSSTLGQTTTLGDDGAVSRASELYTIGVPQHENTPEVADTLKMYPARGNLDASYCYWLYVRWHLPKAPRGWQDEENQAPRFWMRQSLLPDVRMQIGSIWWDDN